MKTTLTQHLESVLTSTNKTNCYFTGATFFVDKPNGKGMFLISPDAVLHNHEAVLYEDDWIISFKLTDPQKKLIAQIYVENKTDKHMYYQDMKKFLNIPTTN